MPLDFHDLYNFKQNNPTLRFLIADHMPLMASFFYFTFLKANKRSIPFDELTSSLDDFLYTLHKIKGDDSYPKSGKEYLDYWTSASYLRKYYVPKKDIPECDLTPETEKALEWLEEISKPKSFVGTESRLLTMMRLIKDLVHQTDEDTHSRVAALEAERDNIEAKLAKARLGIFDKPHPTLIKERFYEVQDTAKRLLGDFRQIEANFRTLDRQTRELIATSEKSKGKLLDEIFVDQDIIRDSEQGKSFRGFWEFLMSLERQAELDELLQNLKSREDILPLLRESFLSRVKVLLFESGEKVYKTSHLLTAQLRKFIDDKVFLENRRIMEIIRTIEKTTIELKSSLPKERDFMLMDELSPELHLPLSRGLFVPREPHQINGDRLFEGESDVALTALYNQVYIDIARLFENVMFLLKNRNQISLKEVTEIFPIEKGLAEIVGYFHLADKKVKAVFPEDREESIVYQGSLNEKRIVRIPQLIFIAEIS
jgi:hypothetical protein